MPGKSFLCPVLEQNKAEDVSIGILAARIPFLPLHQRDLWLHNPEL